MQACLNMRNVPLHYNSRTPGRDFSVFYHLTYSYQSVGKIKNEQTHFDPLRHLNVKMTSTRRVVANLGFSGSFFHVFSYTKCGTFC